jgi:hypothetical protein
MDRRRWLERVANELVGQGLPARVRARLLEELQDHLDDLMEGGETMATEAAIAERMGDPGELAAAASAPYRGTRWVRRHPLLVFGLAPLPAILLGVALYTLALVAVGYGAIAVGYDEDSFSRTAATALVYGMGFIPFPAVAVILGRLVVRCGVSRWWAVAALAQVTLLAGFATVQLTWSDLPGQSQLMVGFRAPLSGWRQAAQLVLPLVAGWLVIRAAGRRPVAAT